MAIRTFLKHNWLGIVGIVSGIIIAYYFYILSIALPQPVFLVDPIRTPIIESNRFSQTPLRVVQQDGSEIRGDVTALRFYFWNDGKESIKSSDILEPLLINIEDTNAKILDYKILKCSRNIVKPLVDRYSEDPNRSLRVSFLIMEQDDGFTGQIIYEGQSNTGVTISGTIEKVKKIITNKDMVKSGYFKELFINSFLPIFVAICVLMFMALLKNISDRHVKRIPIKYRIVLAIIMMLIFTVIPLSVMAKKEISKAHKTASTSVLQKVPKNIIP